MIVDPEILLRLVLAAVVGGIIGYERKIASKPAGIRTLMLISVGSALFTIVGVTTLANIDPSKIIAGIVTGIGFLGAGTIFKSKDTVTGLTTAASMWAVAGLGLAAGLGENVLMATATIRVIVILQLIKIKFIREV